MHLICTSTVYQSTAEKIKSLIFPLSLISYLLLCVSISTKCRSTWVPSNVVIFLLSFPLYFFLPMHFSSHFDWHLSYTFFLFHCLPLSSKYIENITSSESLLCLHFMLYLNSYVKHATTLQYYNMTFLSLPPSAPLTFSLYLR